MSRIRPTRLSRREQRLTYRAGIEGVDYAAARCEGAAWSGIVDLYTGQGAALELARRLRLDANMQMKPRSRLRRKGAR